jgi:hypothetical protein
VKKFFLRGLAEGLTGRSFVMATSLENVFVQFPALHEVREKLTVKNNTISGFCACDG